MNPKGAKHQKYIKYQFNVVRELLTKYGKIDLFWFDALWWGGMFTADMWESEKLTRMMRKLQPQIIINNRASLPGDFDTPEGRIGMYQKRPWESAMTVNGSWAYTPRPAQPVKALLHQILRSASGNGNILLSWGAHFNGEWDAAQKDTLMKIGSWLKKYGKAYYGTKGGPWMPNRDFGSVYNGSKVYIYVFDWSSEGLSLPAIPRNDIKTASILNNTEKLNWKKRGNGFWFKKPNAPDDIVTIIELTLEKAVSGVLSAEIKSLFDDPDYGKKIVSKEINTSHWKKNTTTIDLSKIQAVTGIGIYNNSNKMTIQVSTNGENWETAGNIKASEATEEIALTSFVTGAYIPGKAVRFVRLQNTGEKKPTVKLEVYAKEQ